MTPMISVSAPTKIVNDADHFTVLPSRPKKCFQALSNITWDIIQANKNDQWNYRQLAENPNITLDIVCANPYDPFNDYYLSANPNISLDIIQANPKRQWNYDHLSYNPNITFDIVRANANKQWNWTKLSANKGTYDTTVYKKHIIKYIKLSHFIIQQLTHIMTKYIK